MEEREIHLIIICFIHRHPSCARLFTLVCVLFFFFLLSPSIGPDYWGVINPEWSLCSKGKRQSPIDIQPDQLLFDPTLEPLHISGNLVCKSI